MWLSMRVPKCGAINVSVVFYYSSTLTFLLTVVLNAEFSQSDFRITVTENNNLKELTTFQFENQYLKESKPRQI